MIRLPNSGTYSLELITAQNGAQSVVSYSDATSSAYTGGTQVASITSATTTTICSTPAASTVRDVDQINIKNTFAGSHTVTVQVDANGTNYPLIVAALLTDESLNYTHGSGWQVKDANGSTKNSALTSMTSAQLAAILTDETGSGAAVFANGPTLIAPILGTPASGTVTNLTGTASININGTVGATTPAAGTFTTLTSTGNATLGDAEATDTHAIKGATTLLANSASAGLTITQTGAGNAFVVEDSASPDASPFVIAGSGRVSIGEATSVTTRLTITDTETPSSTYYTQWLRGGSTGVANDGGGIAFSTGLAAAIDSPSKAASAIRSLNSYGSESNGEAGSLAFYTNQRTGVNTYTGLTERMRIASGGTTTLGGTSTAPALSVIPVASQTAWVTITGSNGGKATISTNSGSLLFAPPNTTSQFQAESAAALALDVLGRAADEIGTVRFLNNAGTVSNFSIQAGTGYAALSTNGGTQVFISNTASANRYITLTGATGSNNPTISTSAGALALGNGQLQFPATQNASADANTLDDYEEGTFTPVVRDAAAGNAATAAASVGTYTKVGRLVTANISLADINTAGMTAGNQIHVTALPFASANTANQVVVGRCICSGISSTAGTMAVYLAPNLSYLTLYNEITTGLSNALVSQITSGAGDLYITITYTA
jgi:hypothetical protein